MIELWGLLYLSSFFVLTIAQGPPQEETCDPEWYGRPENQDCKDALARLPDWGMTTSEDEGWETVREFVNVPWMHMSDNRGGDVQTPLVYTNGTCTVAVVFPVDNFHSSSMLVETRKLNTKADALRTKCVENQGSGGLYHGVVQWRGYDMEEFPNVYICGVQSDAERYLDYLYNCITDADGNELCRKEEHAEENDSDWMEFLNDVQMPAQDDPVPKGSKRACSGSCLDLEDCDIGSDCLCASTKGILLSSTWGKHSCMHVVGTALALAAAAIKPNRVCRGRCLLEEDGMVVFDQPVNQTNATNDIDVPLANVTENLKTSDLFVSSPPNKGDLYPTGTPPSLPLPSSSSQASPILICPCNCTYVSASCCLSRIVWEEPSEQIQMNPPPSNASVVCDTGSGKWVPKPAASSGPTEDKSGFIGIGSVKWNSSAANPVKIPNLSL